MEQLPEQAQQARVSAEKSRSAEATRTRLGDLQSVLDSCLSPSSARRPEYERAIRHGHDTLGRVMTTIRALSLVGRNLLDDAKTNPALAGLLADKGLTPELVRGASEKSTTSVKSHDAHGAAQAASEDAQQALDVLDGRLRNQLLRLRRQVERARAKAGGEAIPEVKLDALRATHTSPADEQPATPVTTATTTP